VQRLKNPYKSHKNI